MKDEEKTKEELISELNMLRIKHRELEKFLSSNQKPEGIDGTETILVVDDNRQTRKTIMKMLERYGYHLLETDSSGKAIDMIKSCDETIDLVLSDVVMPEINGPEMVKTLLDLNPDLKIVFMSGYAEDEIVHDDVFSILHSKDTFIEKPFTSEEIGLIVRKQLDNKS